MLDDQTQATVFVALGVGLVLVGLAVPSQAQPAYRYEAQHVEADAAAELYLTDTLDCRGDERSRACALERDVLDASNRTLVVKLDDEFSEPVSTDYAFVRFTAGFYRPNGTVDNGTARLTLEPVSRETVLDHEARGFFQLQRPLQLAILERSHHTSSEEVYWEEDRVFVHADDDYYTVTREPVDKPFSSPAFRWGVKAGTLFVGAVAMLGGWRVRVKEH